MPPSPQKLLEYHPEYRVLVCTQCQYAIQPRAINRHLKEIHKIYRSARHPYTTYTAKYDLCEPGDVVKARVIDFPVPYLPVFDGLRCLDADCEYLCISTKRMQKHWLSEHGRHGYADIDWTPAPLQTFFRGNLLHYFTSIGNSKTRGKNECSKIARRPTATLGTSDQNLLQHFQTETCKTLPSQHEQIWRLAVPSIAEYNPFLMHAVLACSSLHLATKYPSDQVYLTLAHKHQNKAMALFREEIGHVAEANCEAIAAFSHLLVVYAFGAERQENTLLLTRSCSSDPDGLCSWLYFIRNGCTLVNGYRHIIATGPLGKLVQIWGEPNTEVSQQKAAEVTERLMSVIQYRHGMWSPTECEILKDAAHKLGHAFASADALGDGFDTWSAVRNWPTTVSIEYTQLLAEENPVALIFLGYYCLLLKKLQSAWYIATYPLQLLYVLRGKLDHQWHQYIDPLITEWEQSCAVAS
ncbi:hypothetical protein NCS52_00881400 [Fusarium sp. LHS14.1]|nr:hypothetical protein NCS52_00881400 [Fusarium sp. LHS14.1]